MLLDTDFFNKPEVLQLTARFGDSGPMAILRICAALMNEREASLDTDSINALYLGSACNAEKWIQIVTFLLKINWLSEVDGKITSKRVAEERARVEQKRATLSANAKQMLSKCSANANQLLPISKSNAEQKLSISSDTDTEDLDLDGSKKAATPDPLDECLALAQPFICEPTGSEPWETDNQYVNAGRRPLKKYPKIFLSGHELAQVFQQYEAADIPQENWTEAFQLVQAKLMTDNGFNNSTCAFSWLIGWVKNQLLESVIKTTKLKNVRSYANTARN